MAKSQVQVAVVMGSRSDLKVMKFATTLLKEWGVGCVTQIVSAHRTPELLIGSVNLWHEQGIKVIIAGAGGAAHLPGMLAAMSYLPIIGVPVGSKAMNGLDSLLSIAQMPKGVPVATVAVDNSTNAALLAIQILSLQGGPTGAQLRKKMIMYKSQMHEAVEKQRRSLKRLGVDRFLKSF